MPFNQPLRGLVEPSARSWTAAGTKDRRAFYELAGRLAVKEKRAELRRAIGANGRRMKPRKHPRRDGANGPVLTPHDAASRTSRLLDARATDAGVTLFWHGGITRTTKTAWGTILGYHAAGAGHLPIRDARLSRRGIGVVRKAAAKWWTARLREQSRRARAKEQAAQETAPARSFLGRIKDAVSRVYQTVKGVFRRRPK